MSTLHQQILVLHGIGNLGYGSTLDSLWIASLVVRAVTPNAMYDAELFTWMDGLTVVLWRFYPRRDRGCFRRATRAPAGEK